MKTTNKNNENLIAKLQYQLQRYKAMGNGAICQSLNNRIQRLSAQQKAYQFYKYKERDIQNIWLSLSHLLSLKILFFKIL